MSEILFVAGRFDHEGGKPSGYMAKIAAALPDADITLINGGSLDDLSRILGDCHRYRAIWWMPEIDNSVPKFVGSLKQNAPRTVLVISKNNSQDKYQPIDIVGRMLAARANLSLIIDTGAPFHASVLDPLGNAFAWREGNVETVAQALYGRTKALMGFTRLGSKQVGEAIASPSNADLERFFGFVHGYADRFHELVHGVNPSRFLGNASYRCTKGGFPAFRHEDKLYISRRNIDKRQISTDGFVAIEAELTPQIQYYGEAKPSVDAPIQRELFSRFDDAQYMMHAHVYIEDAPYTNSLVPCGALEEVEEVVELAKRHNTRRFNLTGHGCLILAKDVFELENIPFIGRPLPEIVS
jgi:hypothetical protein